SRLKLASDALRDFDVAFPLLWAGIFFLLGLAQHLLWYPIGDLDLETDFYGDMVIAAQKLVQGHFSVDNYPYKGPFYSIPLVVLHALLGNWYRSAVVLNLLSAAGALALWYRLLLALYGRQVAMWTTIFASLVVEFYVQSHRATSDLLFLVMALGSIHLVCTGSRSTARLAVAGILSALACLTRYNAVFLPLAAGVAILFVDPRDVDWRRRLRSTAWYAAGFVVVVVPWIALSLHQTGKLPWSRNAQNLASGLYSGARFQNE